MTRTQITAAIQYQLDLNFCDCDSTSPIGTCVHCDLHQVLNFVQDQNTTIKNLVELVDELLPGIGMVVLQDYGKLNDTLITARKIIQ